MIPKPLNTLTHADIRDLADHGVREGKTIDYKLTLPGGSDGDKKEFLADATSFANAGGGDLLFGVEEAEGLPTGFPGLAGADADAETLRLEGMLRDAVKPRLPGVETRAVDGFEKGPVIVLRVPRSWAGPHMVTFKDGQRFYTRASHGKYAMDVGELRAAFAASDAVGEKVTRFRTERLGRIVAGETPVPLAPGAAMILHLMPFASIDPGIRIDAAVARRLSTELPPLGAGGWDYRHNLDGYVTFYQSRRTHAHPASAAYCQFFRSGRVEAVLADLFDEHDGFDKWISISYFEKCLVENLPGYLDALKGLGVPTPVAVTLSLVGVKGARMYVDPRTARGSAAVIDRDVALLPDVIVEDYAEVDGAEFGERVRKAALVMRPIFDAFWNAAGYDRSYSYDLEGRWSPPRR